ncbi:hypothetical protein BGZ73_008664 [Actinomortierella ambigua]|nr:hypothetical protein BGZ73_008664 [Actinomortierella ambigua]
MSNHFSHSMGIPIYCVGFTHDDNLIIGGGGGAGNSGVKNKIAIYKVDRAGKKLDPLVERELSREEDAPMSINVHPKEDVVAFGINSSNNKIKAGENENCRIFQLSSDAISPIHKKNTLISRNPDDYQKVARFNKAGTILATGGTDGVIAMLKYPSLTAHRPATQMKGHEILDIDFSEDDSKLAVVSEQNMWIISTETGKVLEVITNPVHSKKKFNFRACRFGRGPFSDVLYTVVNGPPRQKPFVCIWDAARWVRIRTMTVGPRPITSCTLSPDGKLIAFGSADQGIRICSAKSLQVLMTIAEAHDLPVISMAFSSDASLLVTGSADAKCRVVLVPKVFPKNHNFLYLVLALLFIFLAFAIQVYQNHSQTV